MSTNFDARDNGNFRPFSRVRLLMEVAVHAFSPARGRGGGVGG